MMESLSSKLYLKQRLYPYHMMEGTSLEDHLVAFKEIVTNLENLEVKYDREDLKWILLCLLSASYMSFRDTILCIRDTLTVEEVYDVLYSKERMKHLVTLRFMEITSLMTVVVQGATQMITPKFVIIARKMGT